MLDSEKRILEALALDEAGKDVAGIKVVELQGRNEKGEIEVVRNLIYRLKDVSPARKQRAKEAIAEYANNEGIVISTTEL